MINSNTKAQIDSFVKRMKESKKVVHSNLGKAIYAACNNVENTAKIGMTNTVLDTMKGYKIGGRVKKGRLVGYKVHYASAEGQYPAVDTGRLRQSITHDVRESGIFNSVIGRVGSPLLYGLYLEKGTSKMKPRPWLYPSVAKNREKNEAIIRQAIKGRPININQEQID